MRENWVMRHVGFVCQDISQAVAYYASLGFPSVGPEGVMQNADTPGKVKVRFVQVGNFQVEFFQPFGGASMLQDFMDKHGEGIQHMAFSVDDIGTEIDALTGRGVELVFKKIAPGHTGIAFFKTGELGDVLLELVQPASREPTTQDKWQIRHLGFIVRDVDRAVAYYQSLGFPAVGPEGVMQSVDTPGKVKVNFSQVGNIQAEFFQPFDGPSMQQAYLDKHGEGIQHMAFTVSDVDRETEALVAKGGGLLFKRRTVTGGTIAYFKTGRVGDVLIELVQPAPK